MEVEDKKLRNSMPEMLSMIFWHLMSHTFLAYMLNICQRNIGFDDVFIHVHTYAMAHRKMVLH